MNTSLKPSSFKVADQFPIIVSWDSWLCSCTPNPDAGSTKEMQQSFERLLKMWLMFWQARQTHVVWALMSFLPLYCQTVMLGQVLRSQQPKTSTAMKGKWLISWESIISISVPENSEYGRLTKTVYPWMGDVSLKRIVRFFCSWQGKGQSLSCKQLFPETHFIKADVRTWLKNSMLAAKPWASYKKLFSNFS